MSEILIALIDFVGMGLAFWVYLANRKIIVNQLFFLMTICILFWINLYYLFDLTTNSDLALLWIRLAAGSVSLFLTSFYFFFLYFLEIEKKFKSFNIIIFIIGIIFFTALSLTNLFIKGVEKREWGNDLILGNGTPIFYFYVFFLSGLIMVLLLQKYFKLPTDRRLKIQYFLMGGFIWISSNLIFNVFFPLVRRSIQYHQLGDYSAIFLLGFTAYAIVAKQLFGIKVVLTELLVGVIGVILSIQIFTASTIEWKILNGIIFILFCLFGYYLIKAVMNEAKRREEAEKLAVDLKRLDETKTQFMLATQHHLRTPLTAIQGYLSLLCEGSYGQINELAKSKIKRALDSTQQLIMIVNEFLDVAQYAVGKELMGKKEVVIEDIIQEATNELKPEIENSGLYLNFERVSGVFHRVKIDPAEIKEAIYNIINNATKYTKTGGITISLERKAKSVIVIIKDTGIGMTEKEIVI